MSGDQYGSFPSTHKSFMDLVRDGNPQAKQEALISLVRRYSRALRQFLVFQTGLSHADAEDLLQDFLHDKFVAGDLLGRVDFSKGRFRSLLRVALRNYAYDRRRTELLVISLDDYSSDAGPLAFEAPPDVLDCAWAYEVIDQALRRMRDQCIQKEQTAIWEIFQARIVRPALEQRSTVSYDELVVRLKLESPAQASNLLMTAKNKFRRILQDIVGEYCGGLDEARHEIERLVQILASAGPLGVESPKSNPAIAAASSTESASDGFLTDADSHLLLSPFVASALESKPQWTDADTGAMLRHQLSASIESFLGAAASPSIDPPHSADILLGESPLELLFYRPNPPVSWLQAVKNKARSELRNQELGLPTELFSVIYFLSIAAALCRLNVRITKSDDQTLAHGIGLIMHQPWVPSAARHLLEATLQRLNTAAS
jgi:DNA-directed RNA polymerase specialized sigma24 family protein